VKNAEEGSSREATSTRKASRERHQCANIGTERGTQSDMLMLKTEVLTIIFITSRKAQCAILKVIIAIYI